MSTRNDIRTTSGRGKRTRSTPKHVWTTAQQRFIRENWQTMNDVQLGAALGGLTYEQVSQTRRRMGINRPPNASKLPRFAPGNVPHNVSKKGKPFLRLDSDGRRRWYIVHYVPGQPRKCMTLGRYVWIMAGREIPAGKRIMQVSGDPANPRLEELRAVSRAECASIAHPRATHETRQDAARRARTTQLKDKAARAYREHTPYRFAA